MAPDRFDDKSGAVGLDNTACSQPQSGLTRSRGEKG